MDNGLSTSDILLAFAFRFAYNSFEIATDTNSLLFEMWILYPSRIILTTFLFALIFCQNVILTFRLSLTLTMWYQESSSELLL